MRGVLAKSSGIIIAMAASNPPTTISLVFIVSYLLLDLE